MSRTTRRRVLRGIGAGSAVGITGLSGCSGDGGSDGGSTGSPGSSGPSSFHLGVFSPFSGPFADWGPAHELGATLAAEHLEAQAGVDVEISTYDTETNPSAAQERMQRAVNADGIDFAWGGIAGTVIRTLGSWTADNGVVYMTEQSTDCYPLMFKTYGSNYMLAQAVAPEMANIADSWYLMYSDYVWGQDAQEIIGGILEEEGASVAGKDATPWPPAGRDFTQYLNNASDSGADGLGLILPGLEATQALRQARNEGILEDFTIMIHQNEDPTHWGVGKWAAESVDIAPTGWANTVEGGSEFKQQVAERGNLDPFVRHLTSYIGVDQVIRASIRAGSKVGEDVRDALEGYEISDGRITDILSGELRWRECDNQLMKPIYLVSGKSQEDMTDSPYKQWFNVEKTVPGADVAAPCDNACANR